MDRPTAGNVRVPPGPLVGRSHLTERLGEVVDRNPLTTLVGVGGVGKTRLAVEVASRSYDRFRDGVWMVELAGIGVGAAVGDAVLAELGILPQNEVSASQTLVEVLAERRMLLVLDNCEHLAEEVADLVAALLAPAGHLRVLATSRVVLGLPAEHVEVVPPLESEGPSSSAVVLFAERARGVRPNFALDDHPQTAEAVVEICRVLDGLPLGIELAAARMAGMGVIDVRDRLGDRFRLLEGTPGAPARQRSLAELVRWSYDLLDDAERGVLLRAGVFVGGFDLHGYVGVHGTDDDVALLRALDRLVRSSLLVADHDGGRVRYRLLETVRQFAIEELAAVGLVEASRRSHAQFFAAEIVARWERWNGPGWGQAVGWVRRELAELRAGFGWASTGDVEAAADIAAHAALIGTSGNLFEPISWAETILEAAGDQQITRLPRLSAACGYACFLGRPAEAAAHADEAMRLEREPGYDPLEPGLSAFIGALAHVYAGDLARYVELATIADQHPSAQAFARPALVDGLQSSGRRAEALELLESAVAAARGSASPFWLTYALWIAGMTLAYVDPPRALSAWDEATMVIAEHDVEFFRGFVARDAARLHTRAGEADGASEQFLVAIDVFARSGNVAQLVITLASVPELLVRLGRTEAALTLQTAIAQRPASVEHVPELAGLGVELGLALGDATHELVASGRAMDLDAAAHYATGQLEAARAEGRHRALRPGGLSRREVEVLRLVADGLTTRQIADQLFIAAKTADRHIQNIYAKIGTSNRATAARWAVDNGVVTS